MYFNGHNIPSEAICNDLFLSRYNPTTIPLCGSLLICDWSKMSARRIVSHVQDGDFWWGAALYSKRTVQTIAVCHGLVPTQVQPMRLLLGDPVGTEPPQAAAKVALG